MSHDCSQSIVEVKATQEAPYHFIDAGIPNVYLVGVKYLVCKICERVVKVQIPAIQDLMDALASALVTKRSPLEGLEIKFLRKRLGIKQTEFAKLIDASPEQLSRWENDRNGMSGAMDRFIRLAYVFISKDWRLKKLIQSVQQEFEKWSTSIQGSEKGERIVAAYKSNRQWCASTQPLAA